MGAGVGSIAALASRQEKKKKAWLYVIENRFAGAASSLPKGWEDGARGAP